MLSLYEAAYLRIHGENILEDALAFTSYHLEKAKPYLQNHESEMIDHPMEHPVWKAMNRLEARHYISVYQRRDSRSEILLEFAKVDFNLLQKQHQMELGDLMRWWKGVGITEKLHRVRDRVAECFFWSTGVHFDAEYGTFRRCFSKVLLLLMVIDDVFELYGTVQELKTFADAVERWKFDMAKEVPDYLALCFELVLNVFNDIEESLRDERKSHLFPYVIKAVKSAVRAYMKEAKLFDSYVPSFEEYLPLGLETAGYLELIAIAFLFDRHNLVTENILDWVFDNPRMITASCTIGRLQDDIIGYKAEQVKGDMASTVLCYMKQYGASEEEAIKELRKKLSKAWKDLNEEWISCERPLASPLMDVIMNLTRMIHVLYEQEDRFTNGPIALKEDIASLYAHPVV